MDVRGWIGGGKRVGLPLPVVKAPGLTAEDPFCFQPSPSCSWSDLLTNIESSAQPESSFIKLVDGIMRTQETTMEFILDKCICTVPCRKTGHFGKLLTKQG